MRSFLLLPSLVALMLSAASVSAVENSPSIASAAQIHAMRCFSLKRTPVHMNLTDTQLYTKALTHRRPTRRATAHQRRASTVADVQSSVRIDVANMDTGYPLGSLSVDDGGRLAVDGSGPGTTFSTLTSSGSALGTQRRILVPSLSGFPNLGAIQYASTDSPTLGPGLSSGVKITGVADPGTQPGDLPAYLESYESGATSLPTETDVWTINYLTGVIGLQWINPDGSIPDTTLISNGNGIAATGDLAAFNSVHGSGWFTVKLTRSA
ncbi:hypothetical protein CPB84DRAFT_300513 [Gymnopilus junonius]|uniref:Uncharacterized protein n=1 Tax=Gymnopilus junonius TaxID=109634 RepID=A0A9P5NSB6_GYMJU|nr:hypothetical protein CPB84DRAFT_300513 [Gymnopilus junonius]